MPFFHHIKNERLRELVMASESILSQDSRAAQNMINDIAMLPDKAQEQMISMLEDEQKQIASKRAAMPEQKLAMLEDDNLKITTLSHEFDREIRESRESGEHDATAAAAESLIKKL